MLLLLLHALQLVELGRLLVNLSSVVPGGIVCFLPSFAYEGLVHDHFAATGVDKKLGSRKKVFREPRQATDVEATLQRYATAANEPVRAVWLAGGGFTACLLACLLASMW